MRSMLSCNSMRLAPRKVWPLRPSQRPPSTARRRCADFANAAILNRRGNGSWKRVTLYSPSIHARNCKPQMAARRVAELQYKVTARGQGELHDLARRSASLPPLIIIRNQQLAVNQHVDPGRLVHGKSITAGLVNVQACESCVGAVRHDRLTGRQNEGDLRLRPDLQIVER